MSELSKGSLLCTPALNHAQVAYLHAFCTQEKFQHDNEIVELKPDPLRIAVGLPLGVDGEYYTGSSYYNPSPWVNLGGYPSQTCPWQPSANGKRMRMRKLPYHFDTKNNEWIKYIEHHFLERWDITLHGEVVYRDRKGVIEGGVIANGTIEALSAQDYKEMKQAHQQRQHMLDYIGQPVEQVVRKKSKL